MSNSYIRLASYVSGQKIYSFDLTSTKMLLGSFENADICIPDQTVSHYHAMILLDTDFEGGTIRDLASVNGIAVNDMIGTDLHFGVGDTITIGDIKFFVEEFIPDDKLNITRVDAQVKPKTPVTVFTQEELHPVEGLEIIEGEYCDIHFNDAAFVPSKDNNPLLNTVKLNIENYVDTDTEQSINERFIKYSKTKSIEVSLLTNGSVISVQYVPLKNHRYFASGKKQPWRKSVYLEGMDSDLLVPFIEVKNGEITVYDVTKNFEANSSELEVKGQKLVEDDLIILSQGTVQIFIRVTDTPAKIKNAPFIKFDKELAKPLAYTCIPVILLSALLMFFRPEPPVEEPKKIAIIYRPAVKADQSVNEKMKEIPDRIDLDKGVKDTHQSDTPPQFAAKQNKAEPKKQKAVAKQMQTKQRNKQVAKVKPYEFKSTNLNTLFGSNPGKPNQAIASNSVNIDRSNVTADVKNISAGNVKSVGTLGSDKYGSASKSFGAYGLSSKKGLSSAYVSPKTVVLGSMDPDLLRKILREYLPQFKHCYQQELDLRSEKIKGVVNLDFRIGANGRVVSAKIVSKNAKFSNEGVACMTRVLNKIKFPKPKGGGVVDVRQPLNFFSERTKM